MRVFVNTDFYNSQYELMDKINESIKRLEDQGKTILNCTVQYVEYSWNFGSQYNYVITYEE